MTFLHDTETSLALDAAVEILTRGDGMPERTGLANAQEPLYDFLSGVFVALGQRAPSREDVGARPAFWLARAAQEANTHLYPGPVFTDCNLDVLPAGPDLFVEACVAYVSTPPLLPPGATQIFFQLGYFDGGNYDAPVILDTATGLCDLSGTPACTDATLTVAPGTKFFFRACFVGADGHTPLSLWSYTNAK